VNRSSNIDRLALTLTASALLSLASWGQAQERQNWPNWRGPAFDGTAANAHPPTEWSEETNVKWKVPIPGKGSATPIVWENQIIVLTAVPTAQENTGEQPAEEPPPAPAQPGRGSGRGGRGGGRGGFGGGAKPTTPVEFTVISLDRDSGKENWKTVVNAAVPHEGTHGTNTFASASPVTDGQHIYAFFGSNGIYCLDMQGEVIWKKDLGKMRTRASFGEGASPALYENTLVVPWDHEGQSMLYALDATTGDELWKVERNESTTWSTPLITKYKDRVQVILNGSRRVCSYDLKDGNLIWECSGQASNPIPTPIRDGDHVIVMTGYQGYAIQSISLDSTGDVSDSDQVVWSRNDAAPYVPSGVLYDGTLYFTKSRDAIFSAVDPKDGRSIIDQERLPQLDGLYASLAAANGYVYAVGRNGTTAVLKHGDKFEVVAVNQLSEGIDASPVMVDDRLFLRGAKSLYCIAEK
jgi:outer membrane protein assembly factor BamB